MKSIIAKINESTESYYDANVENPEFMLVWPSGNVQIFDNKQLLKTAMSTSKIELPGGNIYEELMLLPKDKQWHKMESGPKESKGEIKYCIGIHR